MINAKTLPASIIPKKPKKAKATKKKSVSLEIHGVYSIVSLQKEASIKDLQTITANLRRFKIDFTLRKRLITISPLREEGALDKDAEYEKFLHETISLMNIINSLVPGKWQRICLSRPPSQK